MCGWAQATGGLFPGIFPLQRCFSGGVRLHVLPGQEPLLKAAQRGVPLCIVLRVVGGAFSMAGRPRRLPFLPLPLPLPLPP